MNNIDNVLTKSLYMTSSDSFYSEENINYLKQVISDIDTGKAKLQEHDLIEED